MFTKEKVKPPLSLRSARRSLVKNKISTPVGIPITHHASLAAPKKIIKALYDYQAQGPDELSFSEGDFYHVTARENDSKWFEACNPATNTKGLVPVAFFQVLDKAERNLAVAQPLNDLNIKSDSGFSDSADTMLPTPSKKTSHLYGVVLYDFQAERSDELNAKEGEPIIVIAQSNPEWFVAKPIGRLGGPGLIPVSFVQVRDAVSGQIITNVSNLRQTSSNFIPNVEEWKKMTQGYEASSIPLGRIDKQPQQQLQTQQQSQSQFQSPIQDTINEGRSVKSGSSWSTRSSASQPIVMAATVERNMPSKQPIEEEQLDDMMDIYGLKHIASPTHRPLSEEYLSRHNSTSRSRTATADGTQHTQAVVVSAVIDSFILEGDQYWFVVYTRLSNNTHRILYRLYEDFYDFQINLLNDYPVEAGKAKRERILPYMPGPLAVIDQEITAERQRDLNTYCKDLLGLPRYISEGDLVQVQLFGIHEGDIETDHDPRSDPAMFTQQPQQSVSQPMPGAIVGGAYYDTIKIKIVHKDDIFAIKVPANTTLDVLRDRIHDRLGFNVQLNYKDEITGESMELSEERDMEEAFASAVQRGKLTVFAT
ncbi:hypothetical protein PHYBLDRAFT_186438 [Phycomyces blakesleeanus NRRL 1555(-)]|uniref:SH3 domain-containing protein n=1 Tax=Phycomyces blakesleeanus (strain ATCC 8743b / DSM 1359 / FGSC 10004 / NBRC 33097 / NRRL 1555) TaxID=763407 RepID=A0A163AT21_PHYB8|nr:hypothetical protein PHYBLDRAFT_186438 [Phycomyces blakesleeanus NRRL 1555(-)]OAD75591.1 hypothetical protein PHYBLDRAFT_186438 [Phycomyces blakesleeanus NRRL 1555(-)]|eukprot:XP_018293631.1 hypothetical protein PHYBLDRAFT_186438 [Phycomyces blakesleeanus NRRL 1555(-)]